MRKPLVDQQLSHLASSPIRDDQERSNANSQSTADATTLADDWDQTLAEIVGRTNECALCEKPNTADMVEVDGWKHHPECLAQMERDTAEYNARIQRLRDAGWREQSCGCCGGIEWGGEYPRDCRNCGGFGHYWITPKGRHVEYPGGPFCGRE